MAKKPTKPTKLEGTGPDEFTLEVVRDVPAGLDPHLQQAIADDRDNKELDSRLVSTHGGEVWVDVIARLEDPAGDVPGLKVSRVMGQIVTGAVKPEDIERVREHPNVQSLKRANPLHQSLRASVPEVRATPADLAGAVGGGQAPSGKGVIVGVVDYGCDFAHKDFLDNTGGSRVLFLWDQAGAGAGHPPSGFDYGVEHTKQDMDQALAAAQAGGPAAYNRLGHDPGPGSHGTHVMGIAAGNGRGSGTPGVAPEADIIFVHVDAQFGPEESFGNSRQLLEAVDYIFEKAKQLGRQAVVNLSLGTNGGPHDGSTPVEQGLDFLLQTPGRMVVIAAGNAYEDAIHAGGVLEAGQTRRVSWTSRQPRGYMVPNEVEVWYQGAGSLEFTLVAPSGARLGPIRAGDEPRRLKRGGRDAGLIVHRRNDPNNGDNQIDVILNDVTGDETWGLELKNVGATPVRWDAWSERDDAGQSTFASADADPARTIGSISCGERTLAVGSYDARDTGRSISYFSSAGPTRSGRQKPELSAPGSNVLASSSRSGGGTTRMSGTSMAAPHVSGAVALLMSGAGRVLSEAEIRAALTHSARRDPPQGSNWDARFGTGRMDVAGALAMLRGVVPASTTDWKGNGQSDDATRAPLERFVIALTEHARRTGSRIRIEVEVEPA